MTDNADLTDTSLDDDINHPIPSLSSLDVFAELKNGGGKLSIIVSSPLASDNRTKERLLQKIENYLGFINSDEFPVDDGPQTIENTTIEIVLPTGTSVEVFELLEECEVWCTENNATLLWGRE